MDVPEDATTHTTFTPEEQARRERFRERVLMEKRIAERMALLRRKIVVASGKGGVGKTTAAVNLALAFDAAGDRVALLDADLHGPGVPLALGMSGARPAGGEQELQPVAYDERLAVMSMAFLTADDAEAVIWRGPLKMAVLDQLLADVAWGEREWLVVDTPPGTGDELLSLAQRIRPLDGLVVVTTPQRAAVASARKSIAFARQLNVPVLGVVENMGPFPCPDCGREIQLFGGGARAMAEELGVPFLASVPFDPQAAAAADEGRPAIVARPASAVADAWRQLAARLRDRLARPSETPRNG